MLQIYKKKLHNTYNKKNIMAKAKTSSSNSVKVVFGKKSHGKFKKSYGPKSQKPKKYRGQGR